MAEGAWNRAMSICTLDALREMYEAARSKEGAMSDDVTNNLRKIVKRNVEWRFLSSSTSVFAGSRKTENHRKMKHWNEINVKFQER
jgi:hypothetical protein